MAGPKGLAQHKGKRKCLATVKKKQQEVARLKEPTLLSYLHRQAIAPPTTTDLTRRAERDEAEASSQVVVSQIKVPKALRGTYAARLADRSATSQDDSEMLTRAQTKTLTQTLTKSQTELATKTNCMLGHQSRSGQGSGGTSQSVSHEQETQRRMMYGTRYRPKMELCMKVNMSKLVNRSLK
jgi:hypothetical protein